MSIQQITNVSATSQKTVMLEAAAARVKKDLVRISTGGSNGYNVDLALADDTDIYQVAVADADVAVGETAPYIVEGTCKITVPSGTYVAGNGLHILDGALADSAAAAEAPNGVATNNDVGCIVVGGTTVTEITVTLYGYAITGQT